MNKSTLRHLEAALAPLNAPCELCGQERTNGQKSGHRFQERLAGLCYGCTANLNGGKWSARIVKSEAAERSGK